MIVCPVCGHPNAEDAQFCASCGSYLRWDGSAETARPVAAPAPAATPAVDGPGAQDPRPDGGSATPALAQTRSAPTDAPDPPEEPAPVKPAAARDRPPPQEMAVHTPAARGAEGPYCSRCGAANALDRQLCQACGAPLAVAGTTRLPWWRRLFRRSAASGVPAGERPGRPRRRRARGTRRALRATLAAAVVVAAALLIAGPGRNLTGRAVDRVTGLFTTRYEPVSAASADASSSVGSHPPHLAIDGSKGSYWAENGPGPGLGQTLTIDLDRPVDLARIGITPGASTDRREFLARPRPWQLRLVLPDGSSQLLTLRDESTFQEFAVGADGVDRVVLEILSVYGAGSSQPETAITEVEFFTKQ